MAPPRAPPPSTKYFWGDCPEPDEYYASLGLRHTESYYQSPSGRLFTHSFHPLSADVKAVVFMTHGYGSDSSWLFQHIAISYAQWGYAVYCADLLGHGRSDGVHGYLGDMESVARASLSFFLSVRKTAAYAPLPAFLLGESMGGAATLLMYLRSPPDAGWTGLIFSAPLFVFPEGMHPSRLWLFLYGLLLGFADTWAVLPDKRMVSKAIRDPEKLKESFGEVTVPFLTLHGTDDGLAAPEGSKMLYERAPSEDKSIILYEGMYHSLIQGEPDESRDRVLADMRAWIDERVRRYG
ncbi:hypothetical protein ACQ4PT_034077 [Festuca glaucescens]